MTKFIIEQKITPLANQYRVFDTTEGGEKNQLIAFAHQKRFAFKEEVIFYNDETKSQVALSVKAEKALDLHGKFIVKDSSGSRIGAVRKVFKSSLLRSTWEILGPDDSARLIVQERSQGLAIFRRIWELIPYLGDIPFIFKYHFIFNRADSGATVANYTKTTLFRDHYELDVSDTVALNEIGWETFVVQAVLLDALQGR